MMPPLWQSDQHFSPIEQWRKLDLLVQLSSRSLAERRLLPLSTLREGTVCVDKSYCAWPENGVGPSGRRVWSLRAHGRRVTPSGALLRTAAYDLVRSRRHIPEQVVAPRGR